MVDKASWYSFSDGEGPARNTRSATTLNVPSVDERHQHYHVFEPTPPLSTHSSVLTMPAVPVMTASVSTMTIPATPTKGGATLMSHIATVKKWGVRRRKRTNSTPSGIIGGLFSYSSFFSPSFSNLPFLPSAESQSQDSAGHTPRPRTSMSSFTHVNYQRHRPIPQHRMVLPPQETPNTRMRVGFFELPVALAVQALLLPHVQDQAGGIALITINR